MISRATLTALLAALSCLGLLAVPAARATGCVRYDETSHIVGFAEGEEDQVGVAVAGAYAYVTQVYGGLRVIDVSDPDEPKRCGSVDLQGYLWDVAASGHFAYVTDYQNGRLHIVDVSDPMHPYARSRLDVPRCVDVTVAGTLAYVAGSTFHIVDVADPDDPRVIGTGSTGGFAIAVAGNHAYVAGEAGLVVIDVSDPAHPSQTGQLAPRPHNYDTAVALSGSFACVFEIDYFGANFLRVIDVSDPSQPRLAAELDLPVWDCYSMAASGSSLYVAGDVLLVIDVSDPEAPFIRETLLEDPNGDPWYEAYTVAVAPTVAGTRVFVSGDVCYNLMAYAGWLTILDVPGPPSPSPIGALSLPCCPSRVAALGPFAYVANGYQGVQVIDATDPAHPLLAATLHTPDRARDVAVAGKLAYVAEDLSGLRVLDVSDPRAPRTMGTLDTPGRALAVKVHGGRAFIAAEAAGLQVIDVSTPENPRLLGTADTPGSATDVAVAGSLAYVADGAPGLQVIDVSDPAYPHIVGTLDVHPQAYAWNIAAARGYVYLATTWSGLYVIDVADPSNPQVVGWRAVPDWASGLSATRGDLCLSIPLVGVQVFDLRDPVHPRSVGLMKTAEYAAAAASSGSLSFVIDADGCANRAHLYVYPSACEPAIGPDRVSPRAASRDPMLPAVPRDLRISASPRMVKDRSRIQLALPEPGLIRVAVCDVAGRVVREIRRGSLDAGNHTLEWDGRGDDGRPVAAGIYWVRVISETGSAHDRVVVLP